AASATADNLEERLDEYTELVEAASYWSAEPIDSEKLVFSSIDGMLRTLDPHTTFLEPRDFTEMQDRQKGSFFGLGILITKRNEQITVITPLEGTPASRLGIRAGDIIATIEGESTDDLSVDEVVKRLKGPKGTTVNIEIVRFGIKEPIPLTIERAAIPTNSITNVLMVRPGIGYIRIKDFTYTTVRELDQAIASLQQEGMERLILDLRMNPGGLLDAAVGVSDYFIEPGEMIVYHKGRTAESYQEYRAPGTQKTLDVPVIVLLSRESASASEIVAGAIQDHDRGLVVGETSWGKGLVQSVYSLQYGAGLALTTSRYYTPSGRNIQRDYSSFYDYYLGEASPTEEVDGKDVFETQTGRKVYGGGGIKPDFTVKPRELPHVLQLLQVRSAIFDFAVRYVAEHPEVTRELTISDEIVRAFVGDAAEREIATEAEINAVFEEDPRNRDYIERTLKAEIVAAKFGYDASYPFRLLGDEQVERAIELFPEAEKLASRKDSRSSAQLAESGEGADGTSESRLNVD
ncbi:MAG: S41 family peptidase, partial [Acidobacteria bacterium]|nr:S41 family peptidase [Acidobacteriota bacterium]